VQVRQGDLLDPASLSIALEGVTTVVHLAAALPDSGFSAAIVRQTNVVGTTNLARAARECHVAQLIHCSSAGVYGDGMTLVPHNESGPIAPRTPYEQTKLEAERALETELSATSVSWSILRPSGVHGPGRLASAQFYRRVNSSPLWVHGPATVIVHPTYVGDVVSAVLLTLGRTDLTAQIMNVGGSRALTYPELIELVGRRLGVRVHQFQLPSPLTRAVASVGLGAARRFRYRPAVLERLTYAVVNRSVDIGRARRLLGFEPQSLEVGIDETIAWARQERLL
jgi:dihydroflavonol-4-reductase